jgi:hypothetical protein
MDMQHRLAARTRSLDKQKGHEAWTCSINMQCGKAAWGTQHGHAHTLLKTLAFPPAQWVSTLELGFQCCAAKKGKSAKRRGRPPSEIVYPEPFFVNKMAAAFQRSA